MRIGPFAALGVASVFALACSDSPSSAPTDPAISVRFAPQTEGPCAAATSRIAKAQLMDLLAGATLKQAQAYWAAVEAACSPATPDAANGALMVYVNYLRGQYPAGFITSKAGTKSALFVAHIDTVFLYVGYPAPGLTTTILESGIVQVILPGAAGIREYVLAHLGAFNLPAQNASDHPTSPGDPRGHLFAMFALTNLNCLSVDNLRELSVPCVEVKSFPGLGLTNKFSPGIKVGICIEGVVTAGAGAPALGHETNGPNGRTEVAGQLAYPSPLQCHPLTADGSWTGGPQELLKRLAWLGKSTLGIRSAYATDAGLGGIGEDASPFNALDALIFAASFNPPANVVGSLPDTVNGNFNFTYSVTPPGSILVQSSLGQYTGPLVVLSQGGGACANCGGLELKAHFHSVSPTGSPAAEGVYDVNWISVNASPSVKGAPFVLRDGDGVVGREVARLTYVTNQSQNQLLYNDVVVGSWVRNVPQNFKIRVNLDPFNKWTCLSINGTFVATGKPFVNTAADAIASFGAEFSYIDSGVMGLDELGVQRISDQPAPTC